MRKLHQAALFQTYSPTGTQEISHFQFPPLIKWNIALLMNTSVLIYCKSNTMPSENNINIKWLKYLAVPFQDGFLYSEVQFYMERTPSES
jgi:hypothetical protein